VAPTSTSIELKRHHQELSPKETDEVVEAVADLIVEFLKSRDPLEKHQKGTRA